MKKKFVYLILGLIIFVLIAGGVFYYIKNKQNIPSSVGIDEQTNLTTFSQEKTTSPKTIQTTTQEQTIQQEKYYSMEEVSQHNSKESCWTVIREKVYDLTQFIDKHPGGADKILSLCGKDGSEAFEKKHGGQEKPEKALEQFKIGKLKQ